MPKNKRKQIIKLLGIIIIILIILGIIIVPKIPEIPLTNLNAVPVTPPPCQLTEQLQPSPNSANLTFNIPTKSQSQIYRRVTPNNNEKVIALTIDDGSWKKTTAAMLDIFKENDVKATFFWVGTSLKNNAEIAKQVVAAGHAIGNHTWTHATKPMNPITAKNEIECTAQLMYKTTGVKTSLFRPAGGRLNNGLSAYAKTQNYAIFKWTVNSGDTNLSDPEFIVDNVLQGAKPGAIVLLHDGRGDRTATVKALPEIIRELRQQGYRFVTIPELLEMQY
ncbi:polysaccharide deacetylase family protein [Sphaerospermopsis aphanizomenoides BCCUSP55]|uniref:polysaccharide deacetylase family protein n=1 Tax=Sphaerospermopsis aphanizomenoides TaxID=459663 RepID=UPI000B28C27C|nr:polysaccharide deacetylase family protein [Sphaerospermopsis aphanizomenoides]MBK1986170.1 polysaccharide deacetylase family protein [Sphaerospermopsis aphanizomenoides BCCUSP55]